MQRATASTSDMSCHTAARGCCEHEALRHRVSPPASSGCPTVTRIGARVPRAPERCGHGRAAHGAGGMARRRPPLLRSTRGPGAGPSQVAAAAVTRASCRRQLSVEAGSPASIGVVLTVARCPLFCGHDGVPHHALDGVDDAHVAGAAARLPLISVRISARDRPPLRRDEVARGDQHAGRAVAALQRVRLGEGLAQLRPSAASSSKPSMVRTLRAVAGHGVGDARAGDLAVDLAPCRRRRCRARSRDACR